MKYFIVFVLSLIAFANADCGCLKCSKHLTVVSPPCSPYKVIIRGKPNAGFCQQLPVTIQAPIPAPAPTYVPLECNYKVQAIPLYKQIENLPLYNYDAQIQAPVPAPQKLPALLTNLRARPDRVVIPAPEIVYNNFEDLPACVLELMKTSPQLAMQKILELQKRKCAQKIVVPRIEPLHPEPVDYYCGCCRYEATNSHKHRRSKRHIPILTQGINLVMGLLPSFILPFQHTVNTIKLKQNSAKVQKSINKNVKDFKKQIQKNAKHNTDRPNHLSKGINLDNRIEKEARKLFAYVPPTKINANVNPYLQQRFLKPNINIIHQNNALDEHSKLFVDQLTDPNIPSIIYNYKIRDKVLGRMQNAVAENSRNDNHFKRPLTIYSKSILLEKLKALNEDGPIRKRRSLCSNDDRLNLNMFSKEPKINHCSSEFNNRMKRSIIMSDDEFNIPFFEVKEEEYDDNSDYVNQSDTDSTEYEFEDNRMGDSEEILQSPNRKIYTKKQKQSNEVNPIISLLRAPIQLMKQFHELRKEVFPIFTYVPDVLVTSKRYIKDLGRDFKGNILNIASNLFGNFDDLNHMPKNPWDNLLTPKRYRRNIKCDDCMTKQDPEYIFLHHKKNCQKHSEGKDRRKRYILKVVDEDEVQEFLREKLGNMVKKDSKPKQKKTKVVPKIVESDEEPIVQSKRKIVVKKLKPKVIIDKNGVPFMDINGVKRPLFLKKKNREDADPMEEDKKASKKSSDSEEVEVNDKICSLIEKAKQKIDSNDPILNSRHNEMPVNTVRDKITKNLAEIEYLINMDFNKYSSIYDELTRLKHIKGAIVQDWKQILMDKRINDINSKIDLLNKFKDLQQSKDTVVKDISKILKDENKFMSKKLIKTLICLQKLQCIIQRVIEDFEDHIHLGKPFDIEKEIKYVDYLAALNFVKGKSRNTVFDNLKEERDQELETEIEMLENLRKILDENNEDVINEEANLLWEEKHINKLRKDTVNEMNERINNSLKIRKELKILFDLNRQLENCEEKQYTLIKKVQEKSESQETSKSVEDESQENQYKKKIEVFDFKKYIEDKREKIALALKQTKKSKSKNKKEK